MDHEGHESDDDERREYRRDKFKRERDDEERRERELESDSSFKRERFGSPERGRKSQKYDDYARTNPRRERTSYDSSREFGRDMRDSSRRYREHEEERPDRRRESPPFKRRKREDEWDEHERSPSPRSYDRRRGAPRGRSSWPPAYDDYDRERELRERDREREERYGREEEGPTDYYSGASARASKSIRKNSSLFEGPMKSLQKFVESLEERLSPSEAAARYEEYQNEYKRRQLLVFFNEHKTEEWFKEKYDPAQLELKRLEKVQVAKQNAVQMAELVKSGKADFSLTAEDDLIKEALKPEKDLELSDAPSDKSEETKDGETKSSDDNGKMEESTQKSESAESSNVLFIKVVPPFISRTELVELFKKVPGFKKVSLSEPMRFKNFNRLGWATFDSVESCQSALKELQGKTRIKDFELHMSINKTQEVHRLPKLTPPVASEDARIKIDLEQSKLLCMQLDKEKGIEDNPILNQSGISAVQQLDRIIMYLRKVHFFCYYCGDEFEDEDEMARKCDRHLRGRKKDSDMAIDVTHDHWAQSVDTKIKQRISTPYTPAVYTGAHRVEKKTEGFYAKNVVKIEEQKYRCAVCNKLFMGDSFVKKHIGLKHTEKLDEIKKKALEKQYFENYCNDPKRINPNPTMIPSTGGARGGGRGRGMGWAPMVPAYTPAMPNFFPASPQAGFYNTRGRGVTRGRGGRSPGFRAEPPPGMAPDPRSMRVYVDLDAPAEDTVQIDYRTALDLHKELRKKEN